jgi:hypothetical protein
MPCLLVPRCSRRDTLPRRRLVGRPRSPRFLKSPARRLDQGRDTVRRALLSPGEYERGATTGHQKRSPRPREFPACRARDSSLFCSATAPVLCRRARASVRALAGRPDTCLRVDSRRVRAGGSTRRSSVPHSAYSAARGAPQSPHTRHVTQRWRAVAAGMVAACLPTQMANFI